MGKSETRRARSVVGIDEDSEEDEKPPAQAVQYGQSPDGVEAAADRAPKRQRTASGDGGRRVRGTTAAHSAGRQQAAPAAAADGMDVDQPEQQQAEAAAHVLQHSSKEPDTPFAATGDTLPGLQRGTSSADGTAAAGSGRQRHASRQHKAGQQQQQQLERSLSKSLSSKASGKLAKAPAVPKLVADRMEKARLPWHGADKGWGSGCKGMSFAPPAGAEAVDPPPSREAAVGWGFWLLYKDGAEGDQQQQQQQQGPEQPQDDEQQPKAPQGPVPGTWYRGMVWWFSAKEAAYRLIMEDGEYVSKHTVSDVAMNFELGEICFCRPPCGWPPQQSLAEQRSGPPADAQAEQQEEGQEQEQEAAAAGRRTKQQKAKQERRKPQQQQQRQQHQHQQQQTEQEEAAGAAAAAAAAAAAEAGEAAQQQAAAAADEGAGVQQAKPAKQQQQEKQQQHPKQHQHRPHSGQQPKKPPQQHEHIQGQKQRKHSAGTGASRPAAAKALPPPSSSVAGAEAAAAAAAAATAAAAGLSTPASAAAAAAAAAAGQQRPRSASLRPQQQQQQHPDLSALTDDAARLASCLLKLREGTAAVKQGLELQREAMQDLPSGLCPDEMLGLGREVKRVLNEQQDGLGGALLMTVKHLAVAYSSWPRLSQEVHSGAVQLFQQLQGSKPPGTPSKALPPHQHAGVKQEGEGAAAAAAAAAGGNGGLSSQVAEAAPEAAAAAGAGGLSKRSRDGSVKREAASAAAAAAEQQSPSEQQDAEDDAAAAAGVDGAGKDDWDITHVQSLVPLHTLDDPLREKAVALLSAVLQPPAAASPFALAHELEAKLHDQHGMIGPGKHMYLRHLYMIWCVLGGRELTAAAEAAQRAREAAAAAGDAAAESSTDVAAAAAAAAAAERAAAAARAELEGVPGVADAAAVRAALLDGAASVEELFCMTRTELGFDQQRDK